MIPPSPDVPDLKDAIRHRESPSLVVASLVLLGLDLIAFGGLVVHTLLSRRRYGQFVDRMDPQLTFAQEFFLSTPGPLYAAGFLLAVVALLVKEVALERKSVSLRINVLALAVAGALLAVFFWEVQWPFESMLRP